jgi:hypothetical protein
MKGDLSTPLRSARDDMVECCAAHEMRWWGGELRLGWQERDTERWQAVRQGRRTLRSSTSKGEDRSHPTFFSTIAIDGSVRP